MTMDIFSLLDELQTIARNGLYYTMSSYERQGSLSGCPGGV